MDINTKEYIRKNRGKYLSIYLKKKYPDLDNHSCWDISLRDVGNLLNIFNNLERDENFETIKLLGLTDFKEDIKFLGRSDLFAEDLIERLGL